MSETEPQQAEGVYLYVQVDNQGGDIWFSIEELAMAFLCNANLPADHLIKRLNQEIDFLVAIDGCNK